MRALRIKQVKDPYNKHDIGQLMQGVAAAFIMNNFGFDLRALLFHSKYTFVEYGCTLLGNNTPPFESILKQKQGHLLAGCSNNNGKIVLRWRTWCTILGPRHWCGCYFSHMCKSFQIVWHLDGKIFYLPPIQRYNVI